MTLIATLIQYPFVVALGDLLGTTKEPGQTPLDVPARFLSSNPVRNKHISGLLQKVFNISPHLVMLWAGHADTARTIALKVSRVYDPKIPLDHNLIDDAVRSSCKEGHSVALMFLAMIPLDDKHFRYDIRTYDMLKTHFPDLPGSELIYQGTGETHFHMVWRQANPAGLSIPAGEQLLSKMLACATQLQFGELISEHPHDAKYGGGYEVVTATNEGLKKHPTTFSLWAYTGTHIQLKGLSTQHYDPNGILIYRKFMKENGMWRSTFFAVKNFLNEHMQPERDYDKEISALYSVHNFLDVRDQSHVTTVIKFGKDSNLRLDWKDRQIKLYLGKTIEDEEESNFFRNRYIVDVEPLNPEDDSALIW